MTTEKTQDTRIQKIIDGMTLDEKIGQMFMGGIAGGETVELAKRNFEEYRFGSLQFSAVFERFVRGGNYIPCGVSENRPLDEVAEFLHRVKEASKEITGLPTIMCGDMEGSLCNSIFRRRNVALMPLQMGLAAGGSLRAAFQSARVSARESKTLGLDMLYGPCLDVNTNPKNPEIEARSFSDTAETVASFGEQIVKAYALENVIGTVKHFPGRGHGGHNAHIELESIDRSKGRLERVELLPFKRAFAAGVEAVMVAHTLFPALEKRKLPASLSPSIMQGLLREELGFQGLIMPDELTMFAIAKNFGVPRACALCLEAGSDIVFMKEPAWYKPAFAEIRKSVRAGRISEERIDASLRRILKLKFDHELEKATFSRTQVLTTVGCPSHNRVARKAARDAVVVLKNEGRLMPLRTNPKMSLLVVVPRDMHVVLSNDAVLSHDMLPRSIREYFPSARHTVIDEVPTVPQSYETVGLAKNADLIVFGIYAAQISDERLRLLNELLQQGKPVIVVMTRSPYDVLRLPKKVRGILCSFGMSTFAFQAVADVIAGTWAPTAGSPVRLSASMPRGFSVPVRRKKD